MTDLGTPYWWDTGTDVPDLSTSPPDRADVAIVGAGFTGLTAALTLAEAGASVVVIDAGVPGKGASTRNGGMAGSYPRETLAELTAKYGAEMADAIYRECRASVDHLEDLLARHQIDCGYKVTGRIQLAWTKAHFEAQKRNAQMIADRTGLGPEIVQKSALGDHINTDSYFGGVYYAQHGGLNPRQFHDGLMAAALAAGAQVVQTCPVTQIVGQPGRFEVHTHAGTVRADKVLIATNGYTMGARPFAALRRRVFPLPSFVIATEPLSPNMMQSIAPGGRMMVETRARYCYYRPSPDGTRILWGGRASMTPLPPERSLGVLRGMMTKVWPDLQGTKITHAWTGNTGFSHGLLPHVGQVDGMQIAMGYCGSGVAMAPYLGRKAALQMLDDPQGETAFARTQFKTNWLQPTARPHFLQAANLWFTQVVDRQQKWQARRDSR